MKSKYKLNKKIKTNNQKKFEQLTSYGEREELVKHSGGGDGDVRNN